MLVLVASWRDGCNKEGATLIESTQLLKGVQNYDCAQDRLWLRTRLKNGKATVQAGGIGTVERFMTATTRVV